MTPGRQKATALNGVAGPMALAAAIANRAILDATGIDQRGRAYLPELCPEGDHLASSCGKDLVEWLGGIRAHEGNDLQAVSMRLLTLRTPRRPAGSSLGGASSLHTGQPHPQR